MVIHLKLVKSFVFPFLNHFYFLFELNQPTLGIFMTCGSYPFWPLVSLEPLHYFSSLTRLWKHLNNHLFSMCFLNCFSKKLIIKNHFCDLYYITTHPNSKIFKFGNIFFININHFPKGQNWLLNIFLTKLFPKILEWLPNMLKVICDLSIQKYLIVYIQNIW